MRQQFGGEIKPVLLGTEHHLTPQHLTNMVLTQLPIMLELNPGWVEIAVGNGFEEGNQALNKTLIEVFQTANIV